MKSFELLRRTVIRRQIPDIIPLDYHSAKIRAYAAAYGNRYPGVDCAVCSCDGYSLLKYNGNAVIYGTVTDTMTLTCILLANGIFSLESPVPCDIKWYDQVPLVHMKGRVQGDGSGVRPADLYKMSLAVSEMLGVPADAWYVDMSHRVRHNVSRAYEYGGSYAAIDFHAHGTAYVSSVVSPENVRGQGNIRKILSHISERYTVDLRCRPGLAAFYEHLGLEAFTDQYLYEYKCPPEDYHLPVYYFYDKYRIGGII